MLWGSLGVRNSCGHLFLASSAELKMSTVLRRTTPSLSGQSKTFRCEQVKIPTQSIYSPLALGAIEHYAPLTQL
jgi:hypothetical protein